MKAPSWDTGGAPLANLNRIDISGIDPRVNESSFAVACDVTNPLTGPEGASAVYGPQKGATPEMVERLDSGPDPLRRGGTRRDLQIDVEHVRGSWGGRRSGRRDASVPER